MSISFENIFRTVDKCARTHTRHFKKSRKHRQTIHILHDSLISGFPDKRIRSFAESLVLTLLFRLSKMHCTPYSPAQIQIRFVYFIKKTFFTEICGICASHRGTPGEGSPRQTSPPDCFGSPPALLVLSGQYRTIGVCGLRSKIFCQVAQKDRRLANASQGIYV